MFKIVLVTGQSMIPTLQNGERVLAWTPLVRQIFKRGVIVTLSYNNIQLSTEQDAYSNLLSPITVAKQQTSELFIKRIVGVSGDMVRIPVTQLASHMLDAVDPKATQIGSELVWQVPNEHVFVRGDGLYSSDSVTWGAIPMSQLQQIVLCRFPSFKRVR